MNYVAMQHFHVLRSFVALQMLFSYSSLINGELIDFRSQRVHFKRLLFKSQKLFLALLNSSFIFQLFAYGHNQKVVLMLTKRC